MSAEWTDSCAFQRAALKSESYRILGLLALLCALFVFAVVRGLATRQFRLLLAESLLLGLIISYKALKLSVVKRALRRDHNVPHATWAVVGILIETQIPTITLFIWIASGLENPYWALVAPALLIYFFFIISSLSFCTSYS